MAAMFFCCSGLKSQTERETLRKMLRASSISTWSRRASSCLLRPVEEPELAGHGARVEEVAANIDHHIDRAGLDQLLAHGRLVAAGARRLRGHDDAGAAVLVQVAVEIGHPEIVGVRDLLAPC